MTKTTELHFLHAVVVNDQETVLRIHGTPQMRSARNGQTRTLLPFKIFHGRT
jgi:hypothetical protein